MKKHENSRRSKTATGSPGRLQKLDEKALTQITGGGGVVTNGECVMHPWFCVTP